MSRGSSPRESRKVRSKKPPRRCQSMDGTKNILDDDSLNGSMEFDTKESSPISRHSTRSSGSNSGIRSSTNGSSARLMPRLSTSGGNGSSSPIVSREEQIEARRQKMLKRKTSLKAGSLRRLMDAEAANASSSSNPQLLGDEISIDDTVQIMDDSDEGKKSSKSRLENSKRASRTSLLDSAGDDHRASLRSRRGQRTSVLASGDEPRAASRSRRSQRTSCLVADPKDDPKASSKSLRGRRSSSFGDKYENSVKYESSVSWGRKGQKPSSGDEDGKSRRGGPRSSTSKRDQLKKTLSDKPERRGNRRKSSSALPGRSKSFGHTSLKAQQTKKMLDENGDEEFKLEGLAPSKSLRKIKSVGDEHYYNTAKAGVEQLANLSIGSVKKKSSSSNGSKGENSEDGSLNDSSDLEEKPKARSKKYASLGGQLAAQSAHKK